MHDLVYAARNLRRAPAFTAIVALTLALGIGANTAIFSILYGVLLRPLPYRDETRLVAIWGREIHTKGTSKLFDLYSDYQNWKAHGTAFQQFGATTWAGSMERTLTGRGAARSFAVQPVSADFFSLLGVPAALGRTFLPEDETRECSVVVAHSFWVSVLGSRKQAVGEGLRLNEQNCTVLGIMPAEFAFYPPNVAAMWALMPRPQRSDQFAVGVFGRLKPGVSRARAQAEILLLHHQLHEHDRWGQQVEPVVYDLRGEFTFLAGNHLKLSLLVLFAAVGFVLLICCVNVANLLLGRALGRQHEMAIRAALGSGRARMIRQLLTEALLLSAVAVGGGLALAQGALQYFRAANPIELPPGTSAGVNGVVLGFSAVLGAVTAVLFGLFPAWKLSRTELNQALKAGGRTTPQDFVERRFGQALVLVEIALTVVLLAGAGLLIRSVDRFASAPLGFAPERLVSAGLSLPLSAYARPAQRVQFYDRVLESVRALPQVEGAALSTGYPEGNGGNVVVIAVAGRPDPGPDHVFDTSLQTITPGYFGVMGIPLRRGREFIEADREETDPVAVINDAFAKKYFPDQDPLGRHIREFRQGDNGANPLLRIVGVAGDKKQPSPYNAMEWLDWPLVYRAAAQNAPPAIRLFIRTVQEGSAIGADVQERVAAIDPSVPLGDVETVNHSLSRILAYPRFRAAVLGAFAGLALLLALVGLYGILSRQVNLRTQEIGIRMALGAQQSEVRTMILKESLLLTASGLLAGLAATWITGRFLTALLYGVSAADPLLLAGISAGVLVTALAATWLPARRATSVDPMIALRYE